MKRFEERKIMRERQRQRDRKRETQTASEWKGYRVTNMERVM